MIQDYFDKNKHTFFDDIKDFTKEYNNIRKKNIHKMTWQEWFWFDTSSYQIIYYGNIIIATIIYSLITRLFLTKEQYVLGTIMLIITIIMIFALFNKIKDRALIKGMTFYDHYLREF